MKTSVVKAEILWSRICPLSCSYCAIADGKRNTVPLTEWFRGIDQLKQLGCSFLAIYGAEPLADFDKLPEVIDFAESLGIYTTVITSGCVPDLNSKLYSLYSKGLRSITASFDINPSDSYSKRKTNQALNVIDYFRSLGPVRDSAIVVTLTKENYHLLPDVIQFMSDKDIWTFFDLIHPDRGQPGSKVKNTDLDLLFKKEDFVPLLAVLQKVGEMKKKGYLCHSSYHFFETMKLVGAYMQTIPDSPVAPYIWNCSDYECFPSWVTVDCQGDVHPCDDFYTTDASIIKVWEIADLWDKFCKIWKPIVKERCPGCLWNTHIDSHLIKRGLLPMMDYIHGTEKKS